MSHTSYYFTSIFNLTGEQFSIKPSFGPMAGGTPVVITANDKDQLLNVSNIYFGNNSALSQTSIDGFVT